MYVRVCVCIIDASAGRIPKAAKVINVYTYLLAVQHLQVLDAIECGNLVQALYLLVLLFVDSHNQLAASLDGELVLLAVLVHQISAAHTGLGHARTGLIVDTSMDNTTVMARLVSSHLTLLLQDGNGHVGEPLEQLTCGGQTNDTTTHCCQ